MEKTPIHDPLTRYNLVHSLLQRSIVDDSGGAFPKTILDFLKNIWLHLAGKKTSEIFAAFHEALWVSQHTMLKLDPGAGVFGKRIRTRNSQSELLLAFIRNVVCQFKFSPFFPESVKGDFQLILPYAQNIENSAFTYGMHDSFNLDVEGNYPLEFLIYLGDGRSLRDLRRMTAINADIRALKDMFGYLADDSSNIFPIIPGQKIKRYKNQLSFITRKTILGETYQLKVTFKGLQYTSTEDLKIEIDENPYVLSYFVLDELESHLNEDDKGWDLFKQIREKSPEWFQKRHLRYRHFAKTGEEIKIVPETKTYKPGFLPPHYKNYQAYYGKDIEIIEILVPVYRILISQPCTFFRIHIEFTVDAIKNHYYLKPVKLNHIFKKETLEYIHLLQEAKSIEELTKEKIISLLNMLEISYRSLSFLIMENTVVAGAFTYLTYFGRDTAFAYLLLKPFLHLSTQQKITQQLLNRANEEGEAAHEIDPRVARGKEEHYDYRMRDTDFLMLISIFELFHEMSSKEMHAFLSRKDPDNRYNIVSKKSNCHLNNVTVILRNLRNVVAIINKNELVSLKDENDPSSGNWRDALNSHCRGTYSYDVNAIWIPHLLCLLESFVNDNRKKEILLDFLAKAKQAFLKEDFVLLEAFFRSEKKDIRKKTKNWITRAKRAFLVTFPLDKWRTQLKNFYNDPENQDSSIQDLKKMKIGYYLREHQLGKVWYTAEEFLDDKKWEDSMKVQLQYLGERFFLPNGNPFPTTICVHAMVLDKNKKPIPVVHSDVGFDAFTKAMRHERIMRGLILSTELPLALGGLAIIDKSGESLGFSVANPMLANKNGYELLLTPPEKKIGIDPKALSPWKLLKRNEYHGWGAVWEVMIDFMVAALQDSDLQNFAYLQKHYWWLLENYTRFPVVRNREVIGFKYDSNYEDWFLTEATVEKFEINDLQAFNAAGRLRVLLKALVPGLTNFWLFKQTDARQKEEKLEEDVLTTN
ncbi:MAG: hypothetical protein ACUBOA_05685 [Candidatus Loosdrechtia sp.]|uniref:hypothetical protein n=1 Tax=Candidatus Loosdrechtia sp. TaxID=3101272 RepID=UPI003A6237EF|nr:MAG: hypothetical protein QY305_06485 [Candidatus Jettenia sp. AMX2]